jgi:antitoxin component YwqK of YwqJK toxin-antitoxin module
MGIFNFLKKNKNIENDNGLNESYYDNGRGGIYARYIKKNGNIDGIWTGYGLNGQVDELDDYIDGKLNGECIIQGYKIGMP